MKHGGNIYKQAAKLGIQENKLLDFSANISPLGIPTGVKEAMIDGIDGSINYPDPDCTLLREAIGLYEQVSSDCILCGNGAADLLFRLAIAFAPRKALIAVPTFVEYEEALKTVGTQVEYYYMDESLRIQKDILECINKDLDLVIICNPNNPTGIVEKRDKILEIVHKAVDNQCLLLIDECFLEFVDEHCQITMRNYVSKYKNLIILKSFTKLYAIPGIRLGYCISSNEQLLHKMKEVGQTWGVSHIAQVAGVAALKEEVYKQDVVKLIKCENQYLKTQLERLGYQVFDSQVNYVLFRAKGEKYLYEKLISHYIMIRNCRNYINLGEDYYRVAVKGHEHNKQLIEVLTRIKGDN